MPRSKRKQQQQKSGGKGQDEFLSSSSPIVTSTIVVTPEEEEEKGTTTAAVTPVVAVESTKTNSKKKKTTTAARRTLFPPDNKSAVLVTPSSKKKKKRDDGDDDDDVTSPQPPTARRRLIFGRYVDVKDYQLNVERVYKIVRKLTGSIGGNGYCGPIYGELTMGSMEKMIDMMIEYTSFNKSSRFIDVGSGIGKPNLHVAQYPGVEFSCGVEMEHTRWSLGMTCLKAVLDQAVSDDERDDDGSSKLRNVKDQIQGRCVFLHSNILEAKTFDPFTHVYMFSIGFPPPLWIELSEMWNKSSSEYLICYHGPRAIIEDYGFDVVLLTQTQTSMHGSKEGHMGYLYKRKTPKKKKGKENRIKCDRLFQKSWNLVKRGLKPLQEDVSQQVEELMGSGRRTRRSN